jgi:hypothetical protein
MVPLKRRFRPQSRLTVSVDVDHAKPCQRLTGLLYPVPSFCGQLQQTPVVRF